MKLPILITSALLTGCAYNGPEMASIGSIMNAGDPCQTRNVKRPPGYTAPDYCGGLDKPFVLNDGSYQVGRGLPTYTITDRSGRAIGYIRR